MTNKNIKLLKDFKKYCIKHPEQRFWQALRNWSEWEFIYGYKNGTGFDTFYYEKKEN